MYLRKLLFWNGHSNLYFYPSSFLTCLPFSFQTIWAFDSYFLSFSIPETIGRDFWLMVRSSYVNHVSVPEKYSFFKHDECAFLCQAQCLRIAYDNYWLCLMISEYPSTEDIITAAEYISHHLFIPGYNYYTVYLPEI